MSVITDVIDKVKQLDPGEHEFHQAVTEVMETLEPTVERHPEFVRANIYERVVEPERTVIFRVPWMDDKHQVHVNRGFGSSSTTPSDRSRVASASIRR